VEAPRQRLDGHSLVPLLENPLTDWEHGSITSHGFKNDSLRTERWRLTRYANGSEELYDHDKDPYEWTNLAGEPAYEEMVSTLRERLPRDPTPPVKTKPFDWSAHSHKYHKEFREKKRMERIKRD